MSSSYETNRLVKRLEYRLLKQICDSRDYVPVCYTIDAGPETQGLAIYDSSGNLIEIRDVANATVTGATIVSYGPCTA